MSYSRIKSLVNEELKSYFRPEFLNRLDEIIVFRQLTKKEVKQIADIMLRDVFKRGEEKGLKIEVTEKFKDRWVLHQKRSVTYCVFYAALWVSSTAMMVCKAVD
jgi:ATP-dependent Clp protease ATP-binding subunit ClpC